MLTMLEASTLRFTRSRQAISIARVEDSKFSSMLFFLVGNYFVTFFVVELFAAMISLAKKSKPVRINQVSEAFFASYLLFAVGINNLINFVFHVFFWRHSRKVYRMGKQPVSGRSGIRKSARGNCRFALRH
jgi:hypothetical protein